MVKILVKIRMKAEIYYAAITLYRPMRGYLSIRMYPKLIQHPICAPSGQRVAANARHRRIYPAMAVLRHYEQRIPSVNNTIPGRRAYRRA